MSGGKDELLARMLIERDRLLLAVAGLDQADAVRRAIGDWSIKDIVAHITAWEIEAARRLELIADGRDNEITDIADAEIDSWNARAVARSAEASWEEVLASLVESRDRLLRAFNSVTEAQLTAAEGRVPAATWLSRFTSEHEAEHSAAILKWRNQNQV